MKLLAEHNSKSANCLRASGGSGIGPRAMEILWRQLARGSALEPTLEGVCGRGRLRRSSWEESYIPGGTAVPSAGESSGSVRSAKSSKKLISSLYQRFRTCLRRFL